MRIAHPQRWAVAAAVSAALVIGAVPATATTNSSGGSVDFGGSLQPIDGFGFSAAFGRATLIENMPATQRQQMLDLLLSRKTGAGLSIIRQEIGSSPDGVGDNTSIEPTSPGSPDAAPTYVWDRNDSGQLWLDKQAKAYGVNRFYADAWSAPPFMKTNNEVANGGAVCGMPETNCATGDWRQAYANYLVQYAKFYRGEGIRISDLGLTNEPNFVATYASMKIDPAQVVDMVKVLGPTVAKSGLQMSISCCDATGWTPEVGYTNAVEADPAAARWVNTITGHEYGSPARTPQPTSRHTWMSEWQAGGTPWNMAWDDGTQTAGMTLAEDINDTLTLADANAYVYFFGASTGATGGFLQIDGDQFHVSKRLWAIAAYSRFIRPGAVRVQAAATDPALKISAFRNGNGSKVLEIINTATTEVTSDLRLDSAAAHPTSYLTDTDNSLAKVNVAHAHGRDLTVDLAPRSLTTVVLP